MDNVGGFSTYDSVKLAINNPKIKKEEDKFASVSSENNEIIPDGEKDSGFTSALNSWMSTAINSTKLLAGKVGELEIGTKIINTGNVLGEQGSNLVDKATEVAVRFFLLFYFFLLFFNFLITRNLKGLSLLLRKPMMGLIFL